LKLEEAVLEPAREDVGTFIGLPALELLGSFIAI
jgi:hypothetical protein